MMYIGTCVPLCYACYLLKVLCIYSPIIVYTESFCRVESLSLTGMLLYPIVDSFLVQWPGLAVNYKRTQYIGQLC